MPTIAPSMAIILDNDMAAESGVVGHDNVVPQFAIMGHMDIGHKKVFVADLGFPIRLGRGAMYGRVLPDNIIVAYDQIGLFVPVADVLRRSADARKGMEPVPFSDRGPAFDQDMGRNLRVFSDRHMLPNDRIGPDLNALGDPRLRMYNCCWMNVHVLLLRSFLFIFIHDHGHHFGLCNNAAVNDRERF